MSHRISAEGVESDRAKVAAVLEMPPPTAVLGFRRVCGIWLAEPCHRSGTSQGIYKDKKDRVWCWSQECDEALDSLKRTVTNTPAVA